GVYASSATFPGVYGTSASSDGVDGYTAAAGNNGVAGTSTQPNDTCAPQCVGGDGLFGLSDASNDGSGNIEGGVEGNGYYSLLGVPYDSTSYSFAGTDQTGAVQILIDASGNILTKGSLGVLGVISNISRTVHGYYAKSYGTQAMSHILEDENTSGITNGVGLVHIDPAFTESVGSANYQVFLTPNGDCNGLYVAEKTATSFVVRELRGGRSTLSFDYRIVGHLYGQGAQRMTVFASTGGLGQGAALLGTGHSQKRAIMLAKVKIEQRHVGAAAARSAATLSRQAKSTFATKRRFVLPSVDFSLLGRR
ncbi:MAG TPA: hypothetical protein VKG44_10025, partial [Candidatus Baltobacteraceae bacterium]|nr:hypothetical protein [Candidatus Baltobacteraceae bacterium]